MASNYFLYVLLCENNHLYTGITTDIEKRYQAHCNGTAAKYTRSFKPMKILHHWRIGEDRGLAQKLEYQLKQRSSKEKKCIINSIKDTDKLVRYLLEGS